MGAVIKLKSIKPKSSVKAESIDVIHASDLEAISTDIRQCISNIIKSGEATGLGADDKQFTLLVNTLHQTSKAVQSNYELSLLNKVTDSQKLDALKDLIQVHQHLLAHRETATANMSATIIELVNKLIVIYPTVVLGLASLDEEEFSQYKVN